jgi:tRNA wybutosine-synthesizing protein 4
MPRLGGRVLIENSDTQKVAETADDAALSKLSAARLGYVNDPFIPMFVPSNRPQRRSPLINRGYFARVAAVDLILQRFVATCRRTGDGRSQVISLGAGMDTTFFRLYAAAFLSSQTNGGGGGGGSGGSSSSSSQQQHQHSHSQPSSLSGVPTVYFEVDFADVTAKKASIVRKSSVLQKCIDGRSVTASDIASLSSISSSLSSEPSITLSLSQSQSLTSTQPQSPNKKVPSDTSTNSVPIPIANLQAPRIHADIKYEVQDSGGCNVIGRSYRLVTSDLRDISAVESALLAAGCDFSLPTLLLSECVLIYLEPEESCGIIAWAARAFTRSTFVTYEQIRPHDAFGQMMMRNLEERGYCLRGLNAFPDLNAKIACYTELGYQACTSIDMNDVYYRLLPRAEVARIERLEIFDELEEWHLMSAHYSITVACNELNGMPPQRRGGRSSGSKTQQHRPIVVPVLNIQSRVGSNTPTPTPTQENLVQPSIDTESTMSIHPTTRTSSIRSDMPAPKPKIPRTASYSGGSSFSLSQSQVTPNMAPPPSPPSLMALPSFSPAIFPNALTATAFSSRVQTMPPSVPNIFASASASLSGLNEMHRSSRVMTTTESAKELAIHVLQSHHNGTNSSAGTPIVLRDNSPSISPDNHLLGNQSGQRSRSGSRSRSRSRSVTTDSSDVEIHGGSVSVASNAPHSQVRLHTHTPVDFEAIAESEDELLHARHIREAAGIDLQRETDLGRILPVSTSSLQFQSTSIDQSTTNSCSASVISDRDVDDSTDVFSVLVPQSGSVYPAAVEGSKKLEVTLPSTWNAQSILTMSKEGKGISLLDCLFPTWPQTR